VSYSVAGLFTKCSRVTNTLTWADHSREPPARTRWIGRE
jgi:hypothetical protein